MRQRVVRVAVAAVLVALVLLAGPLAVVAQRSLFEDEPGALERTALAATIAVGPDFTAGDAVEPPRLPARRPAWGLRPLDAPAHGYGRRKG
ncbi:hypothetical protein GTW69_34980 [Streptomyces sp. SID7760]|nr:hypothetical protein [Streptomyces sp. SID7760]